MKRRLRYGWPDGQGGGDNWPSSQLWTLVWCGVGAGWTVRTYPLQTHCCEVSYLHPLYQYLQYCSAPWPVHEVLLGTIFAFNHPLHYITHLNDLSLCPLISINSAIHASVTGLQYRPIMAGSMRPGQSFGKTISKLPQCTTTNHISRRFYAVTSSAAPRFQVFNQRTKWLQKQRAGSNPELSRQADYIKDEVANRLTERLLVWHLQPVKYYYR